MTDNLVTVRELLKLAISGTSVPYEKGMLDQVSDAPAGYTVDETGVFVEIDGEVHELADKPIVVYATGRDARSKGRSKVVAWVDHDDRLHAKMVDVEDLYRGAAGIQGLTREGLAAMPGSLKNIAALLVKWNSPYRATCVYEMGWIGDKLLFVTPSGIIEADPDGEAEPIVYVDNGDGRCTSLEQQGDLDYWRSEVARLCANHPVQQFVLCLAFVSPLLKWLGIEGGGFNFFGPTSRGKTTMLQLFAAVMGCGADPNSGADSSVQRWDATSNGLEGVAARFNDVGLALDELGVCLAKDIVRVIYNLFSGSGKLAMKSDRSMAKRNRWRCMVASSGELPVREKILESGQKLLEGQLVRMVDVPIDAIPVDTGDLTPGEQARAIKQLCATHYGVAGWAFLEALVDLADEDDEGNLLPMSASDLEAFLKEELESRLEQLRVTGLTAEQDRVLLRFAAVAVAGCMASELEILPFDEATIIRSVELVRDAWLSELREADPALKGILNVAQFVADNPDRAMEYEEPRSGQRWLLIRKADWNEACDGVDSREVLAKLRFQGLLHQQEKSRHLCRLTVNGHKSQVYALMPEILNYVDQQP